MGLRHQHAMTKPHPKPHNSTRLGVMLTWIRRHQHATAITILLIGGLLTRFWLFGYPNQTVFDEVYFGKFVSAYFTGNYYFDIHPPLIKLLIAGYAKLFGYIPTASFSAIGSAFTDNNYLILRFLPSLAGALLPLIIYSLSRELGLKTRTALVVGILVILENALLTQSRFILIDSLLLAAGFGSLWAYFVWRRSRRWPFIVLAGVLAGIAIGTKWIALPFLVLPLAYEAIQLASPVRILKIFGAYLGIALTLYLAGFALHTVLLTKSGDGDAFMSREYQSSLEGNQYASEQSLTQLTLPQKIVEINREMYAANQRLTAGHPYGSKWYGWPLMIKPISYWVDGNKQIWLFGNPIIWLGSTFAVITATLALITRVIKPRNRRAVAFLLISFFVCWLPFALISRVMFLYHYLTPLIFAIMILGFLIDSWRMRWQVTLLMVCAVSFLMVAPSSYGVEPDALTQIWRSIPLWR